MVNQATGGEQTNPTTDTVIGANTQAWIWPVDTADLGGYIKVDGISPEFFTAQ